jgi:hypothetical protein
MTLKERMLNVTDELHKYPMCFDTATQCVEIAEDFAIGFAEWFRDYQWTGNNETIKQLLEIYKKKNEL